ncbi:M13 family metallopeptidase [soil metagenome]
MRIVLLAAVSALALSTTVMSTTAFAADPARKPVYGAWGVDLTNGDPTVSPGTDFDRYVNGAWEAKTQIPPDQSAAGVTYDIYNLSQDQLRVLIETAPATSPIGGLYKSFIDEARVEAIDDKPLKADLAKLAAIKTKAQFATAMAASRGGLGSLLVDIDVGADAKNPEINTLYLTQGGGLALPDREYYLTDGFKPQLAAYRAFAERALKMAGHPDPAAEADAVVAFETRIAKVNWARADRRDIEKTYNPMSLAALQAFAPQIDWKAYLAAAGVPAVSQVVVGEMSAVKDTTAIFAETPLETLKAWQTVHILLEVSPYLSKRFVDSRFDYIKALSGQTVLRPRWKRGVQLVDGSLGEVVGQAYVAKHFPAESKAQMLVLIANLKTAMANRIQQSPWMSPATKTQALAKLSKMQVMVGYPDKWRDYSGLKIDAGDLYGNVVRSHAFEWAYQLADLGKPVDHQKWGMTPQTVNAYNSGLENKIVFPAAYLQAPNFDPAADPAVNYGGIGATIGHEISHGFDDQGRKIDASGALRDWWTAEDAKRFEAEAAVLGKQFDGYEALPGTFINGKLTMGENIADLAGLQIALDAYHASLGGKPAPVIDGLTGDQRLFLGYGQSWRDKVRDEALKSQIASDPHAPSSFRLIGSTRNIDAWYAAFGAKPGETYYLKPEDRSRVW